MENTSQTPTQPGETPPLRKESLRKGTDVKTFVAFLRTALMPMLVMKAFILYFGLNYSSNPGEGYGYGLVISILITLSSFGYFCWKYRDSENL